MSECKHTQTNVVCADCGFVLAEQQTGKPEPHIDRVEWLLNEAESRICGNHERDNIIISAMRSLRERVQGLESKANYEQS